jgi:hypothetical protein
VTELTTEEKAEELWDVCASTITAIHYAKEAKDQKRVHELCLILKDAAGALSAYTFLLERREAHG